MSRDSLKGNYRICDILVTCRATCCINTRKTQVVDNYITQLCNEHYEWIKAGAPPPPPPLPRHQPLSMSDLYQGSRLTFGAFPLHGTARYGSFLGGFPLGTVPGTW